MKDPKIIPDLYKENKSPESREFKVNWFTRNSYDWVTPLLKLGSKRPLKMDDLYELDSQNSSLGIKDQFLKEWNLNNKAGNRRFILLKILMKSYGMDLLLSALYLTLYNIANALSPLILQILLKWLKSPDHINVGSSEWEAYLLAIGLFLVQIISTFFYNWQFEHAQKAGFKIRTGLSSALFEKFFRLSPRAKQELSIGKIINVTTTDTLRLDLTCQFINMLWSSPILIILVFVLLYLNLGVASFFGLGFVIFYLPVQMFMTTALAKFRRGANGIADKRMKIIHESLKGIRVIKVYCD
jgi:ABC-type multidrug transport system fused ATPase/permease subunit